MGLLWICTVRAQIVWTDFPHVKQPHIDRLSSSACGHRGLIKSSAWTDIQTYPELHCMCPWAQTCLLLSWLVGFLDRPFTCSSFVSSPVSCQYWGGSLGSAQSWLIMLPWTGDRSYSSYHYALRQWGCAFLKRGHHPIHPVTVLSSWLSLFSGLLGLLLLPGKQENKTRTFHQQIYT